MWIEHRSWIDFYKQFKHTIIGVVEGPSSYAVKFQLLK